MAADDFIVPSRREVAVVDEEAWESPEAAAQRMDISMARLRLLANADTVRVVQDGEGNQGLLARSVDYEVERRRSAGPLRRIGIALSDVFWVNAPMKRKRRPWDES